MVKDNFKDFDIPDGVEVAASPKDDSVEAGKSGVPVNVGNEAEPAPASSVNNELDEAVESSLSTKLDSYQKVEKMDKGIDTMNTKLVTTGKYLEIVAAKADSVVYSADKLQQIYGGIEAQYIITKPQMREFEEHLATHFKESLKAEACKVVDDAISDMKHARKEQVDMFTSTIKGGWWLSTKCSIGLAMFFVLSYAFMVLICYIK